MNTITRPLVPEDMRHGDIARTERQSLTRAITSMALGAISQTSAAAVLRSAWPGDRNADLFLRGAVSPTDMAAFPAATTVVALPRLSPCSAALQLFSRALAIDLAGVSTVRVPHVATPPTAVLSPKASQLRRSSSR